MGINIKTCKCSNIMNSGTINGLVNRVELNILLLNVNTALGQLVVLSDCVCPGHELRLECTVVGAGTTIWRGSAFDCTANRIVFRHSRFGSGITSGCNNGRIIGRSINTTYDSDGNKYTSQLIIQLAENDTLEGRTVECVHSFHTQTNVIGTYTISYTRGKMYSRVRNQNNYYNIYSY